MKRIWLVTGGSRSGKSRYALDIATPFASKAFIATAEPIDEEMRQRIERHRRERDPSYHTIEAPLRLAAALGRLPSGTEIAIIDCITVWLGNLLYRRLATADGGPEIDALFHRLQDPPCRLVVVSNEVGMGLVPATPEARDFRDLAGAVNQRLASLADVVVLTVCGIGVVIKGQPEPPAGFRAGRRPG